MGKQIVDQAACRDDSVEDKRSIREVLLDTIGVSAFNEIDGLAQIVRIQLGERLRFIIVNAELFLRLVAFPNRTRHFWNL
jgi:hypothetical protein